MGETQEAPNILDDMVARIVDRFHPERIILFGSRARGDAASDSDVDLLVIMDVEDSRRGKANEIDLALADRTVPLDLIVMTPSEFARQSKLIGTIASEATREGKVLYERAA